MRIAVVGSNSFSGSHLVARALDDGHQVLGISRSAQPDPVFLPYAWHGASPDFTFVQADLNTDLERADAALLAFRPQVVVNFAAQSMVGQSWQAPADWYRTNVVALAEFARRLQRLDGLERYVHVSTPEVYGSTPEWTVENETFAPSTPYAVSRAAGDWHLLALHRAEGLPVVLTRAANVYGPGQQLYRIVPRAVLSARTGERLPLHGGGSSVRSFIHIADVADATMRVAASGVPGRTYHVSTNELISIRDLVLRILAITGGDPEQLLEPAPERPGKDAGYLLDSSRIRSELGWAPRVGLDDGLRGVVAWIDENLPALRAMPIEYVHKP